MDQVGEFIEFEAQEAQAEEARDGQPQQRAFHILLLLAQHGKTEGDGRQQQEGRIDGHQRQVKQLRTGGAGRIAAAQHAIGGKQGGEDQAVAHQIEPEAQHGAVFRMMLFPEVKDRLFVGALDLGRAHGLRSVLQAAWFAHPPSPSRSRRG